MQKMQKLHIYKRDVVMAGVMWKRTSVVKYGYVYVYFRLGGYLGLRSLHSFMYF